MQQTPKGDSPDFFSYFTGYTKEVGKTLSESLILNAKVLLNVFQEVDAEAVKVAKAFGQGSENILSIKQTLVDAAPAVEALGGKFENVGIIQTELVSSLNRALLLSTDTYAKIYAATEVTGKKAQELFPAFKNVGISAYGVSEGMQKIVDTARQQGLSVVAVSDQAVKNMEAMNKYNFQGGVDGLAKMAAQATSLRIDMGKTLDFAENLYKPEKAIEMSAALQRLGITQSELLDPLRLMDLSINDPAELQNQLVQMTQQFVTMNEAGNFEIAPEGKLRMRELAHEMNIPYEQLTKMALGSAELEDKLSKIRFPEFMSEDQQKMIANLAEMKNGEYVITVGNQTVPLAEALSNIDNTDELNKLIEASEPKSMEEMAKEQLTLQEDMAASLRKIANRVPRGIVTSKAGQESENALRGTVEGISNLMTDRDVLSAKSIRELTDENIGQVSDVLSKVFQGNFDVLDNLSVMGDSFKEFGEKTLDGLAGNLKEQYEIMKDSQNAYAQVSTNLIEKLDKYIQSQSGFSLLSRVNTPADENVAKTTEAAKTGAERTEEKTINTSSTVDVTIKVEAPAGMSKDDVANALGTEEIKQKIAQIVKEKYPDLKTKPD